MRKNELIAIRMRFNGNNSKEIAEIVKKSPGTIDNWFSLNGRLYEEYNNFAEKSKKNISNETSANLIKNAKIASDVMIDLLGSRNELVRAKAAKEIIDRTLGKPNEFMNLYTQSSSINFTQMIEKDKKEFNL